MTCATHAERVYRYEEAQKDPAIIAPYDDSVIIKTYEEAITEINPGN